MASALRGSGLAVYAVELPGHDLAADSGSFAPMPQVVDRVTAEITGRGLARILLWGHSSGAAFALATARKLEEHGVDLERVFVAGQLAGDAATRRAAMTRLAEPADAYRHDLLCAHRFLADALDAPAAVRLTTPLTVVVAADDEITAGYARHWRDWQLLADRVDLHELADGGHYFLRTRPAETARALRHAAGLPASR
jgi:surfactin synthase thioesterase subunit